jgi:hypothetical protein
MIMTRIDNNNNNKKCDDNFELQQKAHSTKSLKWKVTFLE